MQDIFRQAIELMNLHGWSVHPVLHMMPFGEHAPENCLKLQALTRIVIDDQEQASDRIDALRQLVDVEGDPLLLGDGANFITAVVRQLELTVKHILIIEVKIRYQLREEGIHILEHDDDRPARFFAPKFARGDTPLSIDSYAHVGAARRIAAMIHDLESMSDSQLSTLDAEAAMVAIRMLFLHAQCMSTKDTKNKEPDSRARDYLSGVGRSLWCALDQAVSEVTRLTVREYESRYGRAAFNQVMHRLSSPDTLSNSFNSKTPASPVDLQRSNPDEPDGPAPVFSAELLVIKEPIPPASSSEDQQVINRYSVLCQPSPVVVMPSEMWLEERRVRLLTEFRWACDVIDKVFDDLVSRRRFGAVEISIHPILLMGPPGAGKSRLARRIAEELTLPYLPIGLAGMDDSRTFLGTARGWSSGQPSALLQLMLICKSASALVLLDEVEKATNRSLNSSPPASVLLSLLEPETANRWFDSFLQVPCDLSRLNYIATANGLAGISRTLLSRFHIVSMGVPKPADLMGAMPYVIADLAQEWRVPRDVLPNLGPHDLIGTPSNMREMRAMVTAALRVWASRHLGPGKIH